MKIVILGGGASGLMAALWAAQLPNHHVTILERQSRVGRKLLATGNGRCNLTNLAAAPEYYHGQDASFVRPALARFGVERTLAFFRELGLLTVAEPSGRVYPLSDQANSVVDVLRFAAQQRGVQTVFGFDAQSVRKKARGYQLTAADGTGFFADRLIVACGGCAGKALGATTDGYTLLSQLGHTRTALHPGLTQIRTDPACIRGLKGVRADCLLRLRADGRTVAQEAGELQFTETGLSGPVAFSLSREAALRAPNAQLVLDFLKDYSPDAVRALLRARCAAFSALDAEELLAGMLHPRLGKRLCQTLLPAQTPLAALTPAQLDMVADSLKAFSVPVTGVSGFESAQVTVGGIRTAEFRADTLESRLAPGVFACGEVLDIDGACGGFNLQWAWSSGYVAGQLGEQEAAL